MDSSLQDTKNLEVFWSQIPPHRQQNKDYVNRLKRTGSFTEPHMAVDVVGVVRETKAKT
jgi:hypothetical protein